MFAFRGSPSISHSAFLPSTASKYTHSVSRSESGALPVKRSYPAGVYICLKAQGVHIGAGEVFARFRLHLDERRLKKPFRLSREISPLSAITHTEDSSKYNTHEPVSRARRKFLFGSDVCVCALGLRAWQKKYTHIHSLFQTICAQLLFARCKLGCCYVAKNIK
jgi:hypothetical protein